MHTTKDDRRADALERQTARDNRSDFVQLGVLSRRPGESKREISRLMVGMTNPPKRADFVLASPIGAAT